MFLPFVEGEERRKFLYIIQSNLGVVKKPFWKEEKHLVYNNVNTKFEDEELLDSEMN